MNSSNFFVETFNENIERCFSSTADCKFHTIGIREKNSFSDRATVLPFIRLSVHILRACFEISMQFLFVT